jgi:hypothetical protein
VRGVLLMDSPVIGGWRAAALSAWPNAPASVIRRPRHQPQTQTPVGQPGQLMYFRSKTFASGTTRCCATIEHGTDVERDDKAKTPTLCNATSASTTTSETAIYNTLPTSWTPCSKRKPLEMPAAFVGGLRSVEDQTSRHGPDPGDHPD